jgi:hypothetical protein
VRQEIDRLFVNAENLMEQAASIGPASDVTVLELPSGGYYLIAGTGHDLAAMQAEHGAKSAWQVQNSPSSILVTGRSGDRSCQLKKDRSGGTMIGALRDSPSYFLV